MRNPARTFALVLVLGLAALGARPPRADGAPDEIDLADLPLAEDVRVHGPDEPVLLGSWFDVLVVGPLHDDATVRLLARGHEGQQDAPPHLEGILDGLQRGRVSLPAVVAEVGRDVAHCQDQVVVGYGAETRVDDPVVQVHTTGLSKRHAHVFLPAQNGSKRNGNVARIERCGRHLVEQRLKQVVIFAVKQRNTHGRAAE